MTLYKETEQGFVPWSPTEPVDGVRYPSNIEQLWTANDLAALGLYLPEVPPIPEGKRLVSATVARVNGAVQFVHVLEDIPAPTSADFPLSDRQLRIGLIMSGISLDTIDTAINTIPDATQRAIAKVWWDRSTMIQWDHPMRATLTTLVGLTEDQAATMWLSAKDIAA